jgi:hypothetical protein
LNTLTDEIAAVIGQLIQPINIFRIETDMKLFAFLPVRFDGATGTV